MFLPAFILLGNYLAFAPVPQTRLNLPETEGRSEWFSQRADRTDLYGDPLPEGALARIGTERFRAGNTYLAVSYSPDGRTLATAGHAGVDLFDASTGRRLAHFDAPSLGGFSQVAFLPTDKYLVTQSYSGRILFWKLTLGGNRPLRGPETDRNTRFALTGNGKHLAYAKDRTIRLWDVQKGGEVAQLPRRNSDYHLAFSADGKILASQGSGVVTLWDRSNSQSLLQLPPSSKDDNPNPERRLRELALTDFSLSSDGKLLAGFMRPLSGTHTIRIWRTEAGKEQSVLDVIDSAARSMAFSPDGRFLVLASQNHLQLWDARTGKTLWSYLMYGNSFWSVSFSPDGRFVAVGLGGVVKIWETATGRERCPLPELQDLNYFCLSPDGRTVLTSEQIQGVAASYEPKREKASLYYWDAASGNRLLSPQGKHQLFPPFAAVSGDQKTLVSWGKEGILEVWAMGSVTKRGEVTYEEYPRSRVLSDDGRLLVLGSYEPGPGMRNVDAHLTLWDARTGKRLGELKGHRRFFFDVRFSPDGKVLASVDGEFALHLWDTATRKELHIFKPKLAVYRLAFSRDNRTIAIAGKDTDVVFVDLLSGKELPKMPPDEKGKRKSTFINCLLFSPDGTRLFTASLDGLVSVWERETGRLVKEWKADQGSVAEMSISDDGKVSLTQGTFTALVWDLDAMLK